MSVNAPEFGNLGLTREVAKGPPGPAAEVEDTFAVPVPVLRQEVDDLFLRLGTQVVESEVRVAPSFNGVGPTCEIAGRARQRFPA